MADVPEFVGYIARHLAEKPDVVEVGTFEKKGARYVRLDVADQDMGRVIGRGGRVANAMRSVLRAAPDQERWRLEIVD